jgi:hypothetical protein
VYNRILHTVEYVWAGIWVFGKSCFIRDRWDGTEFIDIIAYSLIAQN